METLIKQKTDIFEREKAELKKQIEDHLQFTNKLNQYVTQGVSHNGQLKIDLQSKEAQIMKLQIKLSETNS